MTALWNDLIKTYGAASIEAPHLKVVTLAQWALESDFGRSKLATDHLNFGGLKFRTRVNIGRQLAEPVDYEAHDGWSTYCKFQTLDDFINGYWAFIDNGPIYDGWKHFGDDPSGYIQHLKSRGYAQDPDYVSKIISVVPRIRQQIDALGYKALFESGMLDRRAPHRVAFLIGHNRNAQGAYSQHLGISEWKFNQRLYRHVSDLSPEYEIEPRMFLREPQSTYYREISNAYSTIDAWGPDAILELHFNAGGGHGTEMLYWETSSNGKLLAESTQNAVLTEFGLRNRGVKGRTSGRGSTSLGASDTPTILTEPFFGDSASDCAKVSSAGEQALARAYLIGARDALESF